MSTKQIENAATMVEALQIAIENAGRFNPSEMVSPSAILWTDPDGQWKPIMPLMQNMLPHLFYLGEYDTEKRCGPSIWLRCVVDRALEEPQIQEDAIPILYLPNVSRQALRSIGECPRQLGPLVELQFRGTMWLQRNGKDWTVEAFLTTESGGLGLDVSQDRQTRQAIQGALVNLATAPLARLRGKHLEAEDFDRLMVEDTPRDILVWMDAPQRTRDDWDENKWRAFCSRCKHDFSFEPESDGELAAGEKLGLHADAWTAVWERFCESPSLYPSIPELLRRAKPMTLHFDKEPWPDENEAEENNLRQALSELENMDPASAGDSVIQLETQHGKRRDWVWRKLGKSPLAVSLEYLAKIAHNMGKPVGGETLEEYMHQYTSEGWRNDEWASKALAIPTKADDIKAVSSAVRSLYLPWLDQSARHFHELLKNQPYPTAVDSGPVEMGMRPGECILFVDGLRFDLAKQLETLAAERKLSVSVSSSWAPLPTVTATCKYAASPIAKNVSGESLGQDFAPSLQSNGQKVTQTRFHDLLAENGIQIVQPSETGDPTQAPAGAWTEYGEFDSLGHKLQSRLAARIPEQLGMIMDRIYALLEAGWKQVHVLTDHGWLLLPGGLPMAPLPKYLTLSKWARCALVRPEAHVDTPRAPWYWNKSEQFAYCPGIHCFSKGHEYAHGGISPQECIVPKLTFASSHGIAVGVVSIEDIQWLGLRCRAAVSNQIAGLQADLRTKPNDASSSVSAVRKFDEEGRTGLLVEDEALEGTAVTFVVLGPEGQIIARKHTIIGGEN